MKRIISMLICATLATGRIRAQATNESVQAAILKKSKEFCSLIERFARSDGKPDASKLKDILSFKDSGSVFNNFANDLFDEKDSTINTTFSAYFSKILNNYNQEVDIQFTDFVVSECIDVRDNVSYGFVKVKKTLEYKKEKKEKDEIIIFNLATYKINEVVFVSFYETHRPESCFFQKVKDKSFPELDLLNKADELFRHKNYEYAKMIYKFLSDEYPSYPYPASQLARITTRPTYENYMQRLSTMRATKNLEALKEIYETVLTEYPLNSPDKMEAELETVKKELIETNYTNNMEKAKFYVNEKVYPQAEIFYLLALQFKPNDESAQNGLEKIKKK